MHVEIQQIEIFHTVGDAFGQRNHYLRRFLIFVSTGLLRWWRTTKCRPWLYLITHQTQHVPVSLDQGSQNIGWVVIYALTTEFVGFLICVF